MKRILVVDDEVDQMDILKEWLSPTYEITGLTDSEAAAQLCDTQKFDLLITDFSMPGLNGAQLAAKASKSALNLGLPIILLTGINDDLTLAVIKSIPSIKFVEKPIRRQDFLPIVEEQMRASGNLPH